MNYLKDFYDHIISKYFDHNPYSITKGLRNLFNCLFSYFGDKTFDLLASTFTYSELEILSLANFKGMMNFRDSWEYFV